MIYSKYSFYGETMKMIFINPKTHFGFNKIFGSPQNPEILMSFLNALLYDGHSRIKKLEIIDHDLAPKIQGVKDTYLSVQARLSDKQKVIIEMQVLNVEGVEKRLLYNAAQAYSMQLQPGEDDTLLNPVIVLTLTDFEIFENFNAQEKLNNWLNKKSDRTILS